MNFGVVTGRKPTRPELESLARALRESVPLLSIVDEQRYEVGEELDALLEEVRIEVPQAALGEDADLLAVRTHIIDIATAWVSHCADAVGEPAGLSERLARQAVVDQETPPTE